MPRSTIIGGKNKTIGRRNGYGINDNVSITSAMADDKMVRRPAMVPGAKQNNLASEIVRLRL